MPRDIITVTKFQHTEPADTKMEGPSEDSGEETSEDNFFVTPTTDDPPKIKRRPNLKWVSLVEMLFLLIFPSVHVFGPEFCTFDTVPIPSSDKSKITNLSSQIAGFPR